MSINNFRALVHDIRYRSSANAIDNKSTEIFFLAYSTRLIRKSISSQFPSFPQVCVNKLWVYVARRCLEGVIGKHQQLSGREIGGHLKSWTRSSEVKWLIKFEATSPLLLTFRRVENIHCFEISLMQKRVNID